MKKFGKRMATMGAAVMMAVSMMSVNASAFTNTYNLHYAYGGEQVMSKTVNSTTTRSGVFYMHSNVTYLNNATLTARGEVKVGSIYITYTRKVHDDEGVLTDTGTDNRINKNAPCRSIARMTNNSTYSASTANGTITCY